MSDDKNNLEISSFSFPTNKRLLLKKSLVPFILVAAIVAAFIDDIGSTWWTTAFWIISVLAIGAINYYYMKVFFFSVSNEYLIIKRHAVIPHEIVIEYDRIKDIVIERDFLDRLFGLYQVKFESTLISPQAQKMAFIEGLDEIEAHELKVVLDHRLASYELQKKK